MEVKAVVASNVIFLELSANFKRLKPVPHSLQVPAVHSEEVGNCP